VSKSQSWVLNHYQEYAKQMIKFEFTVDEIDAFNILSAIRKVAAKNDEMIIKDMSDMTLSEDNRNARLVWYRRNKEYTLGLIEKMSNTKV
jgi:hypothetical protein